MIDYKYNEDKALKELGSYIDSTYGEHYSKNKFQATEFIIDGGHGPVEKTVIEAKIWSVLIVLVILDTALNLSYNPRSTRQRIFFEI